jgi:hypothetical protein
MHAKDRENSLRFATPGCGHPMGTWPKRSVLARRPRRETRKLDASSTKSIAHTSFEREGGVRSARKAAFTRRLGVLLRNCMPISLAMEGARLLFWICIILFVISLVASMVRRS